MNVTLIGIGQPLRGDDGVGPQAVRRWSREHPQTASNPALHIVITETPGLDLLDFFRDDDVVILVDAVESGDPAGTVSVRSGLPASGATPAEKTAHGFGVAEAIALAGKIGARLPSHVVFIGVEGSQWELGKGLSEPDRLALPAAVREIQNQISRWIPG